MKTLIGVIRSQIFDAIATCFPDIAAIEHYSIVTESTKEAFGDYQCNSAMPLAKQLKQSPREVAECLVAQLKAQDFPAQSMEIAGPGFINITLNDDFIIEFVKGIHESPNHIGGITSKPQRIIIDYSSPNVAKHMHVGHLRSTVIGDCLARLLRTLGHEVLALNHIGDWGTAFGMLIASIESHHRDADLLAIDSDELVSWYRAAKEEFDKDPQFKQEAHRAVVALQQGDPAKKAIWEALCEHTRQHNQVIYDRLDVHLTDRGESFYQPFLADIVAQLDAKGLLTTHDGAKCVFLDHFKNREGEPLPLIVQKHDGGYNYATTDLAAIRHRAQVEKADRILYVIDSGQHTHMAMVFETAARAGFYDPQRCEATHIGFGLVLGEDGKKFRTRAGDTVKLDDLLNEAIDQATQILRDRNPDWSTDAIEQTAHTLGMGAVKYADLSINRQSDYPFSYEKMLRFEGNTASSIMYAAVRMQSIMGPWKAPQTTAHTDWVISHPSERRLALHLARLPETVLRVAEDYFPNRITEYCYALAERCNAFHRDCRVMGDPMQSSRLLWCALSRQTLCASLGLLGIDVPSRM